MRLYSKRRAVEVTRTSLQEEHVRLMTAFTIENFRSIRRIVVPSVDSYSPVIGLNSTGKSNVLRALNLFFNGHLDEARTPLDLDRDYPAAYRNTGKRQRVAVTVTFDTSNVLPRNSEQFLYENDYDESITIERAWSRVGQGQANVLADEIRVGHSIDDLQLVSGQDLQSALGFIRSIKFRYVPNHLRPADMIRDEIQVLRNALVSNLVRTREFRSGGVEDALVTLSRVAEMMLSRTSKSVAAGSGREVVIDVPEEFGDLVFQLALQTQTKSGPQPTDLQGSGTQSFTLLHVLALLDRTERGRSFGWIKGNIWALEEPESFLHAGLRARFAQDLVDYANEANRQVFVTTHQDEFVRVADRAYLATADDDETQIECHDARRALIETTRLRITNYQHPLMEHPDTPLVIVEGIFDALYIGIALRQLNLRPRWKPVALEEIDPDNRIGGDAVLRYLKMNRPVLRNRPVTAPIMLLRDWEDNNSGRFTVAVEAHETSRVLRCPEHLANPDLDQTFVGIERYLPTDLITAVIPMSALGRPAEGDRPLRLTADRTEYHKCKTLLAQKVRETGAVGPYMVRLVKWIDEQTVAALDEVPVQDFLS